jgi:poly(3-hydroxyalkanoate) depolymerase
MTESTRTRGSDGNEESAFGVRRAMNARMVRVGRQEIWVSVNPGPKDRPPLLLFNGIGANLELAEPFMRAMTEVETVIFDVPGVGGSPLPDYPYRPPTVARWAAGLMTQLGYRKVDVAGVSWGGGIAQQFAHQYPTVCRRLVLAATSPGAIMAPGRLSVLWKMASPRRYTDKGYMLKIAADLYGGAFREDPELIRAHARNMKGASDLGYLYQLLALAGWTSLPWLHKLTQPTLVLMGRDDPLVPLVNGRILARLIRNARLEIIEDGHLFFVTKPQETAGIVQRFVRRE